MSADYQRMMQEQLDGVLDADEAALLAQHLKAEPEAAQEKEKLDEVHTLLTKPPHLAVPERLAATIMARLAKQIQEQAEMQPLPQETRLALMASLSVVSLAMMPMMISASYMVLMAQRSPALLGQVSMRVVALMVIMIDAMSLLLEEIEDIIKKDPKMAPIAFYLIPIALKAMLDYIEGETSFSIDDSEVALDIDDDDNDNFSAAAFDRLSR